MTHPKDTMFTIEVCANSYGSAIAAEAGGAARVELCDNLAEGGTTQSYAQIAACVRGLSIPVYPIIRPRGGNFVYTDNEFSMMKTDISTCKSLNCAGVVFGILTDDGEIDEERCSILVDIAYPMKVTFHRAFDCTKDLPKALETLITLGFERVLSSGGAHTAIEGVSTLQGLINLADGRIIVMPGGGINESNVKVLIKNTGATEFHGTFMEAVQTLSRRAESPINQSYRHTSEKRVREMVSILNKS